MKKIFLIVLLFSFLIIPVSASDYTAPDVPDAGEKYMPEDAQSFGEGLWYVIKKGFSSLQPHISQAAGICVCLITIVIVMSMVSHFSTQSIHAVELVGTILVGTVLIQPSNTLIRMGINTILELAEYGKLLLPVMTAALAAQGGATTSAGLYAGTAFFSALLTTVISKLIVPMVYIYLVLCIANSAIGEQTLDSLRKLVKWASVWCLKIVLYVFTGYISITGVVSGTADAAAVKATKLAISGVVPVVGGIISDASETILVSAGVMKSAAGVYGILALLAVFIGPFLQIGTQYLLLKVTASVCNIFGAKKTVDLIHNFSDAMGMVLAMTGTVCLLLLISTVCFMRGVA